MNQMNPQISAPKPAISISVSPRFEIFHALRLVLHPVDGVHEKWCRSVQDRLPRSFFDRVERFCANPVVWPNLGDAIERAAMDGSFFDILKAQAKLEPERLQFVILEGAIYDEALARDLGAGAKTLEEVIKKIPTERRDWLGFLGLYPYDATSPTVKFYERLISDPTHVRDELLRILNEFWDRVFEDTWATMLPAMEKSASALERAAPTCSLSEIAERAFLRVQIDEKAGYIKSVLGGLKISLEGVERFHFVPSAFNFNRLWSMFENQEIGQSTVVFPFFDPEIALSAQEPRDQHADAVIVEPALIFKTLGDTTRFAMVRILAQSPTTSVDLARRLNVTKATVSHHVQKLRMAGLIREEWASGAVKLSLRREVIEHISRRTIDLLYENKSY